MLFTAVDAARRYQAQQVEGRVFFLDVFHGTDESRLLEESSVFDILGDLGQRLVHNTSRTDIKMAHFRVANLAVRQTDVFARCAEIRMRIFFPKFRQDLEVCLATALSLAMLLQPKPSMMTSITGFFFVITVFDSFVM